MKWFRLHTEIKDDPKMLELDDHQFRLWISLLSMAGEDDERGVIPAHRPRGMAAALHTTVENMNAALALFAELGMVGRREDGALIIINFMRRQYDNPSDQPEKLAERKARHKERQENAKDLPPTTPERGENDTGTTPERGENAEERLYSDSDSDTDSENTHTRPPERANMHTPAPQGASARANNSACDNDFELFWQAYPKHQAKETARKAFSKLRAPPDLLGRILTAITEQQQGEQWQRGIIPHAATWLNGRRWADEPPPAAPVRGPAAARYAKPSPPSAKVVAGRFAKQLEGLTARPDAEGYTE